MITRRKLFEMAGVSAAALLIGRWNTEPQAHVLRFQPLHPRATITINGLTIHRPDKTPLEPGDLEVGKWVTIDLKTGLLTTQ